MCNRINKILVRINLLLNTYWPPIHVPVTMCTYYMLAFIEYQLYTVKLVEPPHHCVYQECIECHLCDDQLLSNTNIYESILYMYKALAHNQYLVGTCSVPMHIQATTLCKLVCCGPFPGHLLGASTHLWTPVVCWYKLPSLFSKCLLCSVNLSILG